MSQLEIPTPVDTPEIKRSERANRRWVIAVLVVASLTLVVSIALTWFRFSDSAKESTTREAAARIAASAERTDCRSAYNSDRAAIIERAASLERQANVDLASYLLGTGSSEQLSQDRLLLSAANEAALNLPPLNDMVDHGYVLNGVRHPPCPTVS